MNGSARQAAGCAFRAGTFQQLASLRTDTRRDLTSRFPSPPVLVAVAVVTAGKFVSIEDSDHGNSFAAMSIGASDNRETFKNLLPNCHKIEPLDHKALGKVEKLPEKRDVAAFIMEPTIRNLGAVVPAAEFVRGVASSALATAP